MNVVDRIYELCAPLRNRGTEKDTRAIIEITVSYLKNCDEKLARTEAALKRCREQRVLALEHTDLTDEEVDYDVALWDVELEKILKEDK